MKNTNAIIASVPYSKYDSRLNASIYRFNCELYSAITKIRKELLYIDVNSVLESNDLSKYTAYLNNSGRARLFRCVSEKILKFNPNINNSVNLSNIIRVQCGNNYKSSDHTPQQNFRDLQGITQSG